MIEKLLLKLRARDEVSAEEEEVLRDLIEETEEVPARKTLIHRGAPLNRSVLLIGGLMCRYKDLRSGRRQVTALHVPGDFLDLHGFTLKKLDHDVMALAPSLVGFAPHTKLRAVTERHPHLTRLLWFTTNLDAAIHREWELSLGQRSGVTRAAHLFCELYERMKLVECTSDHELPLPINQTELGECLGLTVVHTNRVLRELRQRELATFTKGQVIILDLAKLKAFAEFDPTYLYLEAGPR